MKMSVVYSKEVSKYRHAAQLKLKHGARPFDRTISVIARLELKQWVAAWLP